MGEFKRRNREQIRPEMMQQRNIPSVPAGQLPLQQGEPEIQAARAVRTGDEEAAYNMGAKMGAAADRGGQADRSGKAAAGVQEREGQRGPADYQRTGLVEDPELAAD